MKTGKRFFVTTSIFGVVILFYSIIGVISSAQSLEGVVNEGESLDNIKIGKSTADDVISKYGENYKLINHRKYSYEMIYKELGLSFYYCQNDAKKEIFVIEIEPPFKAVTGKGIILGESTFADVFNAYGKWDKSSAGFEYEGVYFDYDEDVDGEDSEDVRYSSVVQTPEINQMPKSAQAAELPIPENLQVERIEEPLGGRTEQADIVLDGLDVADTGKDDEEDLKDEAERESQEDKETKARIVKRIELVEKSGLRQCGN